MDTVTAARAWIAALRDSQQRLAALATPLTGEQLRGRSYCTDWSVAQVLSHIGSQAEIAQRTLDAVLTGGPALTPEDFKPIWDVWDARSPEEQARECLTRDATHVHSLEQLTDSQLAGIQLNFVGLDLDAVGLVWLWLGEHAMHTWDIAVSFDGQAALAPAAASLLIDRLGWIAARGVPQAEPVRAGIETNSPERSFVIATGEPVALEDGPAGDDLPVLRLPAEALIRMVYGRLDPVHTPPAETVRGDLSLDQLRPSFPGF